MENMEKLLSNLISSDDFKKFSFLKNKINIFDTVSCDKSDFLCWLLNPHESHTLGDMFFKELLKTIVRIDNKYLPLLYADMSDLEVIDHQYLAYDNDNFAGPFIFMESRKSRTVCVIVYDYDDSSAPDDILEPSIRYMEKNYKGYNRVFLYYISGIVPNLKKRYKDYIRIDSGTLYNITDEILKARDGNMDNDIKSFLTDYKEAMKARIMRQIGYNTIDIGYKLYSEHKEAIDNIIKYELPCYFARMMFEEVLDESELFEYILYYYVSRGHAEFLCFPGGINEEVKEKWIYHRLYPKYSIYFELFYNEEDPNVYFGVKEDYHVNEGEDESIRNSFRKSLENELNTKFDKETRLYLNKQEPLFTLDIVNAGNIGEVKTAMKKRFDEKCAPYIKKFVAAMNNADVC